MLRWYYRPMTIKNTNYRMTVDTAEDILSVIARAVMLIVGGLTLIGIVEFEVAVITLLLLLPAT